MLRRRLLLVAVPSLLAMWGLGSRSVFAAEDAVAANVEKAHQQLWTRFMDKYDLLLDSTELDGSYERPTPEECLAGKPNALAWWTPVENGAMFNGGYLDGIVLRWKQTKSEEDRVKARRLVKGLLFLNSVGDTPGFVARGVATDGKTPYPMGSNDQTGPWFYGLWRYVESGMAEPEEKKEIIARMVAVADVLASNGWRMPCQQPAPSTHRGSFGMIAWEGAPRLLFLCKAMHRVTGDVKWEERYKTLLQESGGEPKRTRLQVCEDGMQFHHPKRRESWTGVSSGAPLRALWEMETDPALKASFAKGLLASAKLSAESLELHAQFKVDAPQKFHHDWRVLNQWWKPQHTEQEAVDVAMVQVRELGKLSPQRYQEFTYVREPVFAAWVVTLCPDHEFVEQQREKIRAVLGHYKYDKLYYSQFFPAEAAWYRMNGGE
jgi:hypothetical protein